MYGYADLTADKRYTLTTGTRKLLNDLDDVLFVKVLLGGEFPAGFKRLQTATTDMLEDFVPNPGWWNTISKTPLPVASRVNQRIEAYRKDGLQPTPSASRSGGKHHKAVLPCALVYYKGRSIPVNLLEGGPGVTEESLNKAVRFLEYKLSNAISQIQKPEKPAIVFASGHGELEPFETTNLKRALRQFYNTGRLVLDSVVQVDGIDVLVVPNPSPVFEKDKFKIDQYVMQGGKPLADRCRPVDLDSLVGRKEYLPQEYALNLERSAVPLRISHPAQPGARSAMHGIELVTGRVGTSPRCSF
ncbi:MAG: Gldg family protein [Haliscomenobacter sp.]|nr:Gldg family protein [Haliscomenobacter sp.]